MLSFSRQLVDETTNKAYGSLIWQAKLDENLRKFFFPETQDPLSNYKGFKPMINNYNYPIDEFYKDQRITKIG